MLVTVNVPAWALNVVLPPMPRPPVPPAVPSFMLPLAASPPKPFAEIVRLLTVALPPLRLKVTSPPWPSPPSPTDTPPANGAFTTVRSAGAACAETDDSGAVGTRSPPPPPEPSDPTSISFAVSVPPSTSKVTLPPNPKPPSPAKGGAPPSPPTEIDPSESMPRSVNDKAPPAP